MAYGDYIDAATLQDTCDADTGDTPGKAANCKFLGQSEEATTEAANRAHLALAENMDNLKLPFDSMIATVQVGSMTGFSGNTIEVDPTGGAHDLDALFSPIGYVYMGNAGYSGASQEDYDTLFQLLDENYNEVLVDGVEVRVTGIAVGAAVGSGFTAASVTFQLNKTLPTANYRFSYARDATLATLPDDAFIRADIRGLHESAAEAQQKAMYVCALTGPADFVGATALEDAITALGAGHTFFLRAGTYTFGASLVLPDDTTIIGESHNTTVLDFTGGAYDLTVSGDRVTLQSLVTNFQDGQGTTWAGSSGRVNGVYSMGFLNLQGDHWFGEDVLAFITTASSTDVALTLDGCEHVALVNGQFTSIDGAALHMTGTIGVGMTGCEFTSDKACVTSTALLGRFKATDCLCQNDSGNTTYNDTTFVNVTIDGMGLLENCRFLIRKCERSAGSQSYIIAIHCDAKNAYIEVVEGNYHRDGSLLQLSSGEWDDVEVVLTGSSATAVSAADGMMLVGSAARIVNVVFEGSGIGGTWDCPLIYVGGSVGAVAVVEDVRIGTIGASWLNSTTPLVVGVAGYSRLSGLTWNDEPIAATAVNWALVGLNDTTKSNDHIIVERLRINITNAGGGDRFFAQVRIYTDGSGIVVRDCHIELDAIHADLKTSIYLGGDNDWTNGAFTGLLDCEISNNVILWKGGTISGAGGSDYRPDACPIYLGPYVFMCAVQGNRVTAALAAGPVQSQGDTSLIFATESDVAGSLNGIEGGACSVLGNILRNGAAAVLVDPDVTSPDGANVSGFGGANNVRFYDA